jgi:acyl-CoA synthetase (NDP forming)
MLATASAEHYARAMRLLLDDPNVDSLVTIFIPPLVTRAADVASGLVDAARTSTKPVLATFMGVEGAIPMLAPIPAYRFPEAAVAALAQLVEYARWRARPTGVAGDFSAAVGRARSIVADAWRVGRGG